MESRESQLSHINADLAPMSPLPAGGMSDSMHEGLLGAQGGEGKDGASLLISPNLPSDTQKFLRFAGEFFVAIWAT